MSTGLEDSTLPRHSPRARTPELLVITGGAVRHVPLPAQGTLSLGREATADVCIADPELSRLHARLHIIGERIEVEDLASANGTYVCGVRLAAGVRTAVRPGDSIAAGSTLLLVEAPLGSLPATDPAPPTPGAALQRLLAVADRVATTAISVMLQGETGVGKGVLARRIHARSPRAQRRLLELNCAALPEALLEGELFGYERGAFTGAVQARPGLLEAADGGTVFLDEVGELSLSIQAKLLRILEEGVVMRLGAREPRIVDVRVIAATNRVLEHEVARGAFRSDLLYRLAGITLHIPPLRDRRSEIVGLAQQFIAEAWAPRGAGTQPPALAAAVEAWLLAHRWPGNIRELRNVMHRAVALCDGPEVLLPHLFLETDAPGDAGPTATATATANAGAAPGAPLDERAQIVEVLERFAGNQTRAARHLGISRTTLSARLDALAVPRPRKPAAGA